MRYSLITTPLLGLAILAPTSVHGQRVETAAGPVEFVGLEFTLAEDLADSLGARVPDGAATQYPEALLEMGFPRARVDRIPPPADGGSPAVTLITVVERSRAGVLELSDSFGNPGPLPPRWEPASIMFRDSNPSFLGAVTVRGFGGLEEVRAGDPLINLSADQLEEAGEALELLDVLVTGFDRGSAVRMIVEDGDPSARALSAAVLSGFPQDERAWRALMTGLLDPVANVNSFASQALGSLIALGPTPVDWSTSSETVRSLLAGANLAAFPLVVQALTSTEISPSLAPAVLGGNAHLVLGHLASEASPHRELVHRFLVQLRGQDLGADVDAWRGWVDGL
jgi:hypothetical protein